MSETETITKCIIRVRGQINGLDFEFEEQHATIPGIDDVRAMIEFYEVGLGLKGATATAATPAPQSNPPFAAGTSPDPAAGFTCPTHGNQDIKYDPRFNRFECKVRSNKPEPWAGDRPWTDKNGNNWWFCRSRSS